MHILKKLIRVPQVLTIKKEYSQLILQRHAYGTNKDILYENEQINCNNIIKNTKMINYDDVTGENKTKQN